MSNFRTSPYAWDDREPIEVYHCINTACGFVTEDSSKLVYQDSFLDDAPPDAVFCPHCGEPIEVEEKWPPATRGRQ
jgi:hypothetical protein